ncbi:MAG TPA: hypothetical protein VLE26_04060 [Alphaproteobacteria bacterium]|nr:hypothetical protein [Alphaproteobacteria bacterium]
MNDPVFVVHELAHARAALAAAADTGRRVVLLSPPDAAVYLGLRWMPALAAAARSEFPNAVAGTALDCGDRLALALEALRHGAEIVLFTGPKEEAERLRPATTAAGADLWRSRPPALDLGTVPTEQAMIACREWIDRLGAVLK